MSRLAKIPPNLMDALMTKQGEGLSVAKIQSWLLSDHNIKISDQQIRATMKKVAEERKEQAKAAYAKAVAESANQDIFILADKIDKFNKRVDVALKKEDDLTAIKIADTMLKFIDRRMKLSGVDQEDTFDSDNILENLLEKLGK